MHGDSSSCLVAFIYPAFDPHLVRIQPSRFLPPPSRALHTFISILQVTHAQRALMSLSCCPCHLNWLIDLLTLQKRFTLPQYRSPSFGFFTLWPQKLERKRAGKHSTLFVLCLKSQWNRNSYRSGKRKNVSVNVKPMLGSWDRYWIGLWDVGIALKIRGRWTWLRRTRRDGGNT